MKQLLYRFSEAASRHGLQCSSQEVFRTQIIGLDAGARKLLWTTQKRKGEFHSSVIALEDIHACSVKKQYSAISPGALDQKNLEEYLMCASLHLEGRNEIVEIPFYHFNTDHRHEAAGAERKARNWSDLISQLLTPAAQRA